MANLVAGDRVEWTEAVFHGGSFSRWGKRPGTYVGDRRVAGTITRSSYGEATTAHWLTIMVEASDGVEPVAVGAKLRRKAATVYGGLQSAEDGPDHAAQVGVKAGQKLRAAALAAVDGRHDPIRAEILREQAARAAT